MTYIENTRKTSRWIGAVALAGLCLVGCSSGVAVTDVCHDAGQTGGLTGSGGAFIDSGGAVGSGGSPAIVSSDGSTSADSGSTDSGGVLQERPKPVRTGSGGADSGSVLQERPKPVRTGGTTGAGGSTTASDSGV